MKKKIINWANERNLIKEGNPQRQLIKTHEEIQELLLAIYNNDLDEVKDAIGDIVITLIIFCEMKGLPFEYKKGDMVKLKNLQKALCSLVLSCYNHLYSEEDNYYDYHIKSMLSYLEKLAYIYDTNIEECLEYAYNNIKDIMGKVINGTFVKDN